MNTASIGKRTICSCLCIAVILLGAMTLLPTVADAKLVKKAANAQQVSQEEIQRYRSKNTAQIERMAAGDTVNKEVWSCLGAIGILVIAVALAAGS